MEHAGAYAVVLADGVAGQLRIVARKTNILVLRRKVYPSTKPQRNILMEGVKILLNHVGVHLDRCPVRQDDEVVIAETRANIPLVRRKDYLDYLGRLPQKLITLREPETLVVHLEVVEVEPHNRCSFRTVMYGASGLRVKAPASEKACQLVRIQRH